MTGLRAGVAFGIMAWLLSVGAALADCTNVEFVPGSLQRIGSTDVYDPFSGETYLARYGLTLRRGANAGDADCVGYIVGRGVGPERRLSGLTSARKLPYTLLSQADQPLAFVQGTSDAFDRGDAILMVVAADANAETEAQFLIEIPANRVSVAAGEVTGDAKFELRDGQGQSLRPRRTAEVTLAATVKPAVQLLLAGGETAQTLNFRELVRNEVKRARLLVTANTPYSLSFGSESHAALETTALRRLQGGAYDDAWRLAYTATLDGELVDYAEPMIFEGEEAGDRSKRLEFTVTGDPDRVRAGTYQDVVSVTIQATGR